jgi:hypothetical protein
LALHISILTITTLNVAIRLQYRRKEEKEVKEKREEASTRHWEIVRNVAAGFRELSKFIVAQERLYTFPVCCLMCVCQGNKASPQQLQQLNRRRYQGSGAGGVSQLLRRS